MITNKFFSETSLLNQNLNFEKLVTNPLEVSFYPKLPKKMIRYNKQVYKLYYQIKTGEFLISKLNSQIKT